MKYGAIKAFRCVILEQLSPVISFGLSLLKWGYAQETDYCLLEILFS